MQYDNEENQEWSADQFYKVFERLHTGMLCKSIHEMPAELHDLLRDNAGRLRVSGIGGVYEIDAAYPRVDERFHFFL